MKGVIMLNSPNHFSTHILACSDEDLCIPLTCELCREEIPSSAVVTFEGADYVFHFCGPGCLEIWKLRQPELALQK